ncbi:G patch domain-containing protein 1 isoform X2 [Syngnathus scovelli]|uniref:G patch domain-containing protein 1 isoform X2 n=1 Tax=Syngnathus scovelli TaxID=161590 RepID=UPI00210FC867|nr:G patch domain-containing protein 1 isoform X2 [Syngnathus scovelli]
MAAGGIDVDDGKAAVDFVTYGTPLEPLEEDEAPRKPIPLHEQTVRDEKGRYQRFHGAFTGGFSAGYYNTVGSKEGWTPSTFVSSRQQKADKHRATPQDFMDEEDLGEHGIAPTQITTTGPFASRAPAAAAWDRAKAVNAQTAIIPGDNLLDELIAPARSSIGVELLTRMGWKAGQGVGPRVKRKARRQRPADDGPRVFGCAPPPPAGSEGSEEDDDGGEFAPENVTFAPKDVIAVDFAARTGLQGLGYSGLDPAMALRDQADDGLADLFSPHSEATSRLFGERPRRSRRGGGVAGQAFGVGALEDDDEDVYRRDAMSKYDTVLGDEPGDGLYGWTAPCDDRGNRNKHHKEAAYLGKILEGFTLARSPEEKKIIFAAPPLPADFRPVRRFRPPVAVSHVSGVSAALAEALRSSKGQAPTPDAGRHHVMSDQRGALLGEAALPGPASVMELLRPEDRRRLLSLRAASGAPPGAPPPGASPSGAPPPSAPSDATLRRRQEEVAEAAVAWRGCDGLSRTFKPFEKNAGKQARYDTYLGRLQLGEKDALDACSDPSMTEWERSREKEEFVRASILYRPTSSMLASRFTRAKQDDDDDYVEVAAEREGHVEDKEAAVKMKMFGQLTRDTFEWHPDKLLCRRFNVAHPYPGSSTVGLPKVKRDKFSVFNFLTLKEGGEQAAPAKAAQTAKKSRWDQEAEPGHASAQQASDVKEASQTSESTPDGPRDLSQSRKLKEEEANEDDEEADEDDEEEEEEEEEEEARPPMDVFKAIFAGSSDDDDDDKASSSSSRGGGEQDEEERMEAAPPRNLFDISSSQQTAVAAAAAAAAAAPPRAPPAQEAAEFGPKLPPPCFRFGAAAASLARAGDRKDKKQHKRRKDKKKKSKKKKMKVKQQEDKKRKKSKKTKKEEDSSEQSDHQDAETTAELIRRLKSAAPPLPPEEEVTAATWQ